MQLFRATGDPTRNFVQWNTGVPAAHNSQAFTHTVVLDINGDGLPDIMSLDTLGHFHIYEAYGQRPDLLVTVNDNAGLRSDITYGAISDPAVATSDPGTSSWPLQRVNRGMTLVSRVDSSSGATFPGLQTHSRVYTYKNGTTDVAGRGWLGFE